MIVPSNTYIATWLAVSAVGATIIPVEPNPITHLIELDSIKPMVTGNVKAILAVNLYGKMCDLRTIRSFCDDNNLFLVDDCAQSHGASVDEKLINYSHVSCWSFYPGKNLGAIGDAGAITSDNKDLINYCNKYKNYGSSEKYKNDIIGANRRLDEIQAAFLLHKINNLKSDIVKRREVAHYYLKNIINTKVHLPPSKTLVNDSWHLFVIKCNERDILQNYLNSNGIATVIHYPIPPHKQKAYKDMNTYILPIADELSNTVLSIPCNPYMTNEEVAYVCKVINDF